MAFTLATALTRLGSGPRSPFAAGLSAPQKLQRVNEVLERFYEFGTWRGLHNSVSLTSSSGIITLPPAYQRLDGLGVADQNRIVRIKSRQWAFSQAGPGVQDWTLYGGDLLAIDMGDNDASEPVESVVFTDSANGHYYEIKFTNGVMVLSDEGTSPPASSASPNSIFQDTANGHYYQFVFTNGVVDAVDLGVAPTGNVRQYQLTGNPDVNDTLSFTGLARKRFTWLDDTNSLIFPDSYQALVLGVRALGWEDEGDDDRANGVFQKALAVLNGSIEEFEVPERTVTMRPEFSGRSIRSLV